MKENRQSKTKPPAREWPKTFRHKQTKKKVRVMPWWECLDPIVTEKDMGEIAEGRKIKIGSLVQVGWLLENEHGIWFGVSPKALEQFTEVKRG